jgi:hypothetical protein
VKKEVAASRAANNKRDKFADKTVGWHPTQISFQESPRRKIIGDDAGQVDSRSALLVKFTECIVATAKNFRAASTRPVQPQCPKVSNAHRLTINKSVPRRDAAGSNDAILFQRNDGLVFPSFDGCGSEEARLAFQGDAD